MTTKTYGDRTFRAGSVVWNSLPDELRLETSIILLYIIIIFLKIYLRLSFLIKFIVSF